MISSVSAVVAGAGRWAGVFHNRFGFFFSLLPPFTPAAPHFLLTLSVARAEYSVLCWIIHSLGTFIKKESEKSELLSLPIPKSKNK